MSPVLAPQIQYSFLGGPAGRGAGAYRLRVWQGGQP